MFDSGSTMLAGGSLAPHSSQHVGRYSWVVPLHKRSCGCLSRQGDQGSAISAFNPLAAQWCVSCRQGFSSSVCQAVVGATWTSMSKVYQQCWKEWAGWCAKHSAPNNAIAAHKLANFSLHLFQVGLAWHTIGIYRSAISAFLETHCLHKASYHPVISKLMHHFYLQCPPFCKCFDAWDVEHLLSLLESWHPLLISLPLTLLEDCYSVRTCYCKGLFWFNFICIDNQHLFFLGHLPLRFVLSLTPMLIFALFFIWWFISDVVNHLGQSRWITCDFSFLGNNRQHRMISAKTISSCVTNVI